MDFLSPLSVSELAVRFQLTLIGDDTLMATGINEIHKVRPGDITFVDIPKYYDKSLQSAATVILINQHVPCPEGKVLLVADDPFSIYNQLVWEHRPMRFLQTDRGENVHIGQGTQIDHGVHIGHDVQIGDDCYIQPGVYIGDNTKIGHRVNIQAGALIGTDAFYYKKINGVFHKWRSGGRVILEDDVEIGAGSTVNRGVSGETILGKGTKLDAQVHIGHGVVIGSHCLIAAQTGIGGKTVIGDRCIIYGQVGIAQNLTIGSDSVILAKSGVSKNLPGGETYFGYPADVARDKFKEIAFVRQILDDRKEN